MIVATRVPDTGWFKSSHSGGGNEVCVEVRLTPTVVGIRDAKNPGATPIRTTATGWSRFLATVKAGHLDLP